MALDIYWLEGRSKYQVGALELDNNLSDLINQFNRTTGQSIDLYGTSRLYLAQWEQLIQLAKNVGYTTTELVRTRLKLADNYTEGVLLLDGD